MSSNEHRPSLYTPSPPPNDTKTNHENDDRADDMSWASVKTPPRLELPFMTYACQRSHEAGTEPERTHYFVEEQIMRSMIKAVPYRCPLDDEHHCWVNNPSYDHEYTTSRKPAVALFPASALSKLYDPTRTEQYRALTLAPLPARLPSDGLSRAARAHADMYTEAGWVRDEYHLVRTDVFPRAEVSADAAVADVRATAAGTSRAMALAELPGDSPPGPSGVSGSSRGMGSTAIRVSDHAEGSGSVSSPSPLALALAERTVLGGRDPRRNPIPRSTLGSAPPSRGRSRATSSVRAASQRGSTTATAGPVNPTSSWHSGHATPRDDEEAEL